MGIEVRVPRLPESVTEAEVGNWYKKPGDQVRQDEPLLDLETDKVVLEVPSPSDGILQEIRKEKGATVNSEEVLGIVEVAQGGAFTEEEGRSRKITRQNEGAELIRESAQDIAESGHINEVEGEKMPLSGPSVRRLIKEYQLDPGKITATGKEGRLTQNDVIQFLQSEKTVTVQKPPLEVVATVASKGEEPNIRQEPMSRLRQRIAERVLQSQQSTATLTTFNEVNMQEVMNLRHRYRDAFEKRYGVRLGLMSFFIKACIEAFKRYPVINAAIEDNNILYYQYYHIGIAVATPRGLVVPILRDADQFSFAEIETKIIDFAQRARNNQLTLEELTGGTFTITNGGVFGSLLSTPILNPPQSAILGMHKVEDRPVAENGEVKIRPMTYVALSYDHRLIDGKEAVQFLVAVKEALEDPVRLLLGV
ncbi:2-oxoglutarate dehydrogenase E2 subunit dihydrolipoamide succinyltransferase [Candidatus Nitrosoglobus terrae]|uniref:Dihydrolipoyllysine-residue succinyltransferase component of 2-oxoglutarate dehydrogenase complex n=1 Tax=Candidatus Nitrosoglobus terrae TaxID=1630141 RepID=A0A1Q2SPJ7_9GAMM|nr:2-oxoglutarate dehydrogenase complex dihydrolipoyllysine-residue succinyltransferase [Candidatus Nitrosoglobus terrae]BAW81033.1 2-oxoglutarate dehydrogenase E2 subunit dihydrolipoamide succinyltransferase [Candidatus Nitrosoglobus terrae]